MTRSEAEAWPFMSDSEYIAALNRDLMIANAERDRYRAALEHIAQAVGAKANGTDAKLMAKRAREALAVDHA